MKQKKKKIWSNQKKSTMQYIQDELTVKVHEEVQLLPHSVWLLGANSSFTVES